MKLNVDFKLNLKDAEVRAKVKEATRLGLQDTIVAIHGDTLRNAKSLKMWITGNNNRSIAAEVSGMGLVASGGEGGVERMVNDTKLEAALYSTSGYGGFLETGTYKMPARPYFRPALDAHKDELAPNIKKHLESK